MIKNILFDLEGTLIDSKALQISVLEKVFNHFGVDTKNIDMLSLIGPPLIKTFAHYFGENSAQNALDYYENVFKNTEIKDIYTFPQILEALPILKRNNYRLFTTSLQILEVVERELEYLGLREYFDVVAGDSPTSPAISKTQIAASVIEKYKLKKSETALVGDTVFDREAAEQNSLRFLQVAWGYGNDESGINTASALLDKLRE